jgi:transposase InsO family protein
MVRVSHVDSPVNTSHTFLKQVKLHGNDKCFAVTGLTDTGADVRFLVHPRVARRAQKLLGAKIVPLKKKISTTDWTARPSSRITSELVVDLEIEGRLFPQERLLIAECGYDLFIGNEWLYAQYVKICPYDKSFEWPDKKDRRMKGTKIRSRSWRIEETSPPITPTTSSTSDSTAIETQEDDLARISALQTTIESDPRQERWAQRELPTEPIRLETYQKESTISISAIIKGDKRYTRPYTTIPFPQDENPEHIKLVRQLLPDRIKHLGGFFSKKASAQLPPSRSGFDVVLELERPLEGAPPSYRTPVQYIPLEAETIRELLEIGFIRRSGDDKPASVLYADKPHSTDKRFCVDYRWRNKFLKPRLVPAPDVKGTIAKCGRSKRFTKIDIIRAFNRLLIDPGSRYLTSFRTRQGTFEWNVLPFGLNVGPAWWQAFINAQLNELLDECASAYADDILIYGEGDNEDAHWEDVEEIIHRLHNAELQGDIKKSRFNVKRVDYLGMIMEAGEGISIDPEKIEAINNWKFEDLSGPSAIRSFLGLCNYVRIFCHHASSVAEPLNRLLKKDAAWRLGDSQRQAFEEMKRLATTAPVLAFFDPTRRTKVETDASRNATAGILWQEQDDKQWKPTGYFSKTMLPTERAYPIQDRELLAVVQTLKHFQTELFGGSFVVITDHEALKHYSTKRLLSTRHINWNDFLSNFDITWQYRPGRDNVAADALSRKTVDLKTVKEREAAERTMALIDSGRIEQTQGHRINAIPIEPTRIQEAGTDLNEVPRGADLVDLITNESEVQGRNTKNGKLFVPELTSDGKIHLRTALIQEAHTPQIYKHQGQNKTYKRLEKEYTWPAMKQEIRTYINNCYTCGRNKRRHDKTPGLLHPLEIPHEFWDQVVVDGKEMPEDEYGYNYVWAFVDKFSRMIARLPGKKIDKGSDVAMRYYRYLYRFLSLPAVFISDNGGQFISDFIDAINKLTGTKHRKGSPRHAQSQGAVERTNLDLDQDLRPYIDKYQQRWSVHLPAIDFAHNSSWHSAIDMAPLKVMTGRDPRDPLSVPLPAIETDNDNRTAAKEMVEDIQRVQKLARENIHLSQEQMKKQANKKRRPVDFGVGDKVFVSRQGFATTAPTTRLGPQWAGPYEILEEKGHSFLVDMPDWYKGSTTFHADRLRKAAQNPLPGQKEDPPEAEEIDGAPEWEVEEILSSRVTGRNKKLQYQVQWVGYDPDETWQEARNLKNAPAALKAFHDRYPRAAGPPVRLLEWLAAAAEDKFNPDHEDDNKAEHGDFTGRETLRRQ